MLVVVTAATVFLHTLVSAALYPSSDDITEASADYPATLSIPSLGIEAAIQRVGVNAKGNIASPSNYRGVAWYSKGTVPGGVGSAVIAGHLDNSLGLDGVFRRLADIKAGDPVYVKDSNGKVLEFTVTKIRYFEYDDPSLSNIFLKEGDRRLLRLVTCGGAWVPEQRTYNKRVIVTAEFKS